MRSNMGKEIRNLFTCRNCQWGDDCPAPHGEICEYYDSISAIEEEMEEKVLSDIRYIEFEQYWLEYIQEYK